MYLTSLRVQGLQHADGFDRRDLERVVELPWGPDGVGVADAISLVAASLDTRLVAPTLVALGVAPDEASIELWDDDGLPTQAAWGGGVGARALLAGLSRQVSIAIELKLDPPLYGRLRQQALHEPRLVAGLGQDARLKIKVGWLFTNDLGAVAISRPDVRVGDVSFTTLSKERPRWVTALLVDLGGRFRRAAVGAVDAGARLFAAAHSPDMVQRERYRQASEALAAAPFSLGKLELVRDGDRVIPCFGESLLRPRQYGVGALLALELVEAVYLSDADILCVENPGAGHRDALAVTEWLDQQVNGDAAQLEQVLRIG